MITTIFPLNDYHYLVFTLWEHVVLRRILLHGHVCEIIRICFLINVSGASSRLIYGVQFGVSHFCICSRIHIEQHVPRRAVEIVFHLADEANTLRIPNALHSITYDCELV